MQAEVATTEAAEAGAGVLYSSRSTTSNVDLLAAASELEKGHELNVKDKGDTANIDARAAVATT